MSSEDFMEKFISSCISSGKKSQKDICEEALSQMKEIDEKLRESNQLRVRLKNLKQVLRELGHDSIKKSKSNEDVFLNINSDKIEDSIYLPLMIKICNFIENNSNQEITSREIINNIGSMDNDQEVYICIKNLYDYGILARDSNRNVVIGPKWDERPILNNKFA